MVQQVWLDRPLTESQGRPYGPHKGVTRWHLQATRSQLDLLTRKHHVHIQVNDCTPTLLPLFLNNCEDAGREVENPMPWCVIVNNVAGGHFVYWLIITAILVFAWGLRTYLFISLGISLPFLYKGGVTRTEMLDPNTKFRANTDVFFK
jgi:hypothetical protein